VNLLKDFFLSIHPVLGAFIATSFTWVLTALGASTVFFLNNINRKLFDGLLGFTGGIMLAASFFSLLLPAVNMSQDHVLTAAFPVSVGFLSGALFLFILDKTLPHLHINFGDDEKEGISTTWHRTTLLVLAITLHNIPEGLAVGMAFGAVALGLPHAEIGGAIALAIGIGIQNVPEGLAVALPLRRQGVKKFKCFWYGQLSAAIEPIAGVAGALLVIQLSPALPYALAFAAGAMIYVVVEEVIPESQRDGNVDISTLGLIAGFLIMMTLDVALT
jgi:zinc transporter, ZIP family